MIRKADTYSTNVAIALLISLSVMAEKRARNIVYTAQQVNTPHHTPLAPHLIAASRLVHHRHHNIYHLQQPYGVLQAFTTIAKNPEQKTFTNLEK